MEDEALVAAFMEATGCGREDAFDRLARCGGQLGKAINSFFSIDAGPSRSSRRRSRSPPPPSTSRQVSVSESSSSSEDDDDAVRARPVVPPLRTSRVSRWDSETRVVERSRSSRRRERRRRCRRDWSREIGCGTQPPCGDHNRSGRRRRFREDIFSDGEEEDVESNNSRHRRRLNPTTEVTDLTSEGDQEKADDGNNNSPHRFREDDVTIVSSDDDDDNDMLELAEEPPRPAAAAGNRTFEDLFKVPHELTYKGGFHAAKAHAAWRGRWLLANVQSFDLPLPSLHQNRDVWGNDLVARCVTDRFVLWQADAAADDKNDEEEAKKVLGYYNIPHDKLPVVVVVDPVTGQAMDVLHGSAACELNDFMVRLGPYTEKKPTIPAVMAKKSTISGATAGAPQSNTRPAMTSAPTSSERTAAGSRQQQAPTTTTVMRKQPADAVVAEVAVAPTCQTRQELPPTTTVTTTTEPALLGPCARRQQPESLEEKVCVVRVRLPDGRVVTKEFGSQCAVAALFAYCRSMLGSAGEAPPEKPFRLLRFVGRATEEIGDQNASFQSLGLHLTTVSVHLG